MTVEMVEVLGANSYVYGTLEPGGTPTLVARLDGSAVPRPGEVLPLRFDAAQVHWFDTRDGKRLA